MGQFMLQKNHLEFTSTKDDSSLLVFMQLQNNSFAQRCKKQKK